LGAHAYSTLRSSTLKEPSSTPTHSFVSARSEEVSKVVPLCFYRSETFKFWCFFCICSSPGSLMKSSHSTIQSKYRRVNSRFYNEHLK
jgi:hypothetical protein